ncbi:MAG: adenosine deaminase [Pseudomonadota bacterium]
MSNNFAEWIAKVPKAELHLHLDGSLQAERMLALAKKHSVALPYTTAAEVEAAYEFENLQSFLDLYYLGASVLKDEEDFYWLMMDYLHKCHEQNIVHTEIMIEPQTYLPNGVQLDTMMAGFKQAMREAKEEWNQSTLLILSFLRHLPESEAIGLYQEMTHHLDHFAAVGLASSELGHPPEKFKQLYAMAKSDGLALTAHAGEEGPPEYIWSALDVLDVGRIDHGVRCLEDQRLVGNLVERGIALTVCPLSNVKLCVFDSMYEHNLNRLIEAGLRVTVNSDDPTYFGGFLNENYQALVDHNLVNQDQAMNLIENGFKASLLAEPDQQYWLDSLRGFAA